MDKLIKHRGLSSKMVKENSYMAIKKALESPKYLGVEFDVRETQDNRLVIYHNSLYNGKLISNLKYIELPKYVPELKEILKIKSDKIFLIEIKYLKNPVNFINLLNKYPNKNIYVMSFSNELIKKVDIPGRKYKIGILNYVLNTSLNNQKLDFLGILNSLINDKVINLLKDYEIFSYGIFKNRKYADIYYIV